MRKKGHEPLYQIKIVHEINLSEMIAQYRYVKRGKSRHK